MLLDVSLFDLLAEEEEDGFGNVDVALAVELNEDPEEQEVGVGSDDTDVTVENDEIGDEYDEYDIVAPLFVDREEEESWLLNLEFVP